MPCVTSVSAALLFMKNEKANLSRRTSEKASIKGLSSLPLRPLVGSGILLHSNDRACYTLISQI